MGLALFAAQQICFALETALIHSLGTVGVLPLALLRSLGGIALVFALSRGALPWRTAVPRLMVLRCGFSLAFLWIFVAVYRTIPLADATAISYTQGLWLVLFGVIWLGEPIGWRNTIPVAVGLIGTLLIVHPDGGDWLLVVAAAGAALNAAALALSRQIERKDTALTIMLYVSLSGTMASLPGACTQPWPAWWPMLGVFLLGPVGQYVGILAVRTAGLTQVAPVSFLRLPISLGVGLALFAEIPSLTALLGSAAIVASNTISWSKRS